MINKHAHMKDAIRLALSYDPLTGDFEWISGQRRGLRAGSIWGDGYRYIQLERRPLLAHRIAWLLHHGDWPNAQIDHLDGDRSNNRIANLREASTSQNGMNRDRQRNNRCGHKGVYLHKQSGLYHARITSSGMVRSLGYFKTPEEAAAAYAASAPSVHGDFARVRNQDRAAS